MWPNLKWIFKNIKTKIVNLTLLSPLLIKPTMSTAELSLTPQTPEQWRSVTEREKWLRWAKHQDFNAAKSVYKTQVLVIVLPQCASACLDAIDVFKQFTNTQLFGAPSSADSLYMDVRLADLPSGLGKVIVPNKVYVNRARWKGDYYKPDIAYNDIDWTTDKLLEKIKQL